MNDYSLSLTVSAVLGIILFFLLLPKKHRGSAPLIAGFAVLCGLVLSRLAYWLTSVDFYLGQAHDLLTLFRVRDGGLSMFGALYGAVLGCFIGWKCLPAGERSDLSFPSLTDALAPALCLFVLCERLHEYPLLQQDYGLDLDPIPLLTVERNDLTVLNTGLISAVAALVILAVLLLSGSASGHRSLLFFFLFGLVSILTESLRQDRHMVTDFVRIQQILAFVMTAAAVIVADKNRLRAVLLSLLLAGAVAALEFALDGRIRPPFEFMTANVKLSWYILFVIVLCAFGVYGILTFGNRKKELTSL